MDNPVAANPGESAGSQSAEPSTALDSPSNLNFWEPEDDQANPSPETSDGIAQASEPAETTEGGQEAEADDTEQVAEPAAHKLTDDALIDLGDEKVSLRELKDRGLRDKDYRYKTEAVKNERTAVRQQAERLQQSVNALAELLASELPSEPDPSLLYGTPEQRQWFHDQNAIYQATQAKLHQVLQHAHTAQTVTGEVDQAERAQRLNLAAETLASDPEVGAQIRDPAKARQFFETAYKAAEAAGYSRQELQAYTDPRAFKMAWLAGIGQQALAAKAKAQAKVEKAPPVVAPQKAQQGQKAVASRRSQQASTRLNKSGSIHDAMGIDFD